MPAAASPIDDFRPPYHLGAAGCALFGTWDAAPPPAATDGFEPVCVFGCPVGAALALRYERLPPDHPDPYCEVILAHLVRRGSTIAAMPFDLVLDDAFFVEAGLRYYHLPKRLDATLRLDVTRDAHGRPTAMAASAVDLSLSSAVVPIALPLATPIIRGVLGLATAHVPVLGTARRPVVRSTIRLLPEAGQVFAARGARLTAGPARLRPLAALYFPDVSVTVGVPEPLP